MAHLNNIKKEYIELRERLDRYPVGAPETKDMYEVLRLLFTEEEARIASRMPMAPATAGKIARRTGIEKDKVEKILTEMSFKGSMMDFHHQRSGKTFYMLPPTVVGFFEFSLMRRREDLPQKELAEAMHNIFENDDIFAHEVFQQQTQVGRALVHETALPDDDITEVLDWERASMIVSEAKKRAVSLCYCLHKAQHAGKGCDKPEEICLSLGQGAEWLTSKNLGREISKEEALDLLAAAREHGLVHIADNIVREPTFICNCCGCCCGMLGAINNHGISNAVHTTGFIASVDTDACKGCGKCARRCPINAITIKEKPGKNGKKIKWAEVDKSICLGCGVCESACKFDALTMKKRKNRKVLTPQSTLDRILTMAIERGKLQHFLFDDVDGNTGEFLKNIFGAVLRMPLSKKILLNKELKSNFVEFITKKSGM